MQNGITKNIEYYTVKPEKFDKEVQLIKNQILKDNTLLTFKINVNRESKILVLKSLSKNQNSLVKIVISEDYVKGYLKTDRNKEKRNKIIISLKDYLSQENIAYILGISQKTVSNVITNHSVALADNE